MARKKVKKSDEDVERGVIDYRAPHIIERFLFNVISCAGNITKACHETMDTEYQANILRQTIYYYERDDADFATAFREAQQLGADVLEDEARRRAFEGVEKTIYHQGIAVDTAREYSNTLMVFLLKGAKPEKYKDRVEHTGDPNAPVHVDVKGTPLVNGFLSELGSKSDKDGE